MSTLDHWLFPKIGSYVKSGSKLVDVGAFHGDFTKAALATGVFGKSFLFEPNLENVSVLENSFGKDERIVIINKAVGDTAGHKYFSCASDKTTGSLLKYDQSSHRRKGEVREYKVELTTLDSFLREQGSNATPVGLLKTDAQGYDFSVLKGAEATILESRPWIVVELMFVPLYEGQCCPYSIISWLVERDYAMAGLFDAHYTQEGWTAFADAVFIPSRLTRSFKVPFTIQATHDGFDEVRQLRQICEERLLLINRLSEEAAKRAEIISGLQKKWRHWNDRSEGSVLGGFDEEMTETLALRNVVAQLEAKNAYLQEECDKRLKVIEELDKAARERLAIIERLKS